MAFSSVLAMGDRREIGRYEDPRLASLFGLGMGMILAVFQIWGMMFWLSDELKRFVRKSRANGPRCLR